MKKLVPFSFLLFLIAIAFKPEAGKGTISCRIDGKQRTFIAQKSFFAVSLDSNSKSRKNGLEIQDGSFRQEGFQFRFKKSGVTKIRSDSSSDKNCIFKYYNSKGITYIGENITVTVTLYNINLLKGVFSGKLVNAHYEKGSGNYAASIMITDGRFTLVK
jgi:hypothetical protein